MVAQIIRTIKSRLNKLETELNHTHMYVNIWVTYKYTLLIKLADTRGEDTQVVKML